MVKVKCFTCKNSIEKEYATQYIKEGQKTPKYFCNYVHQGEYMHSLMEKELKQKRLEEFKEVDIYIASEILGYDIGQITPPNLKKRIQELAESYPYEVIKLCLELMKDQLKYYLTKNEYTNERHMVNYVMVVIKENINDAYLIYKKRKEIAEKQNNHKIEMDVVDKLQNEIPTTKVVKEVNTGIMNFLDEGDY